MWIPARSEVMSKLLSVINAQGVHIYYKSLGHSKRLQRHSYIWKQLLSVRKLDSTNKFLEVVYSTFSPAAQGTMKDAP